MKHLVQQLLTDRFRLVMHRESKVLPVYCLVRTKGPAKLAASSGAPNGIPAVAYTPLDKLHIGNATMADFAVFLQRFVVDRPVIDQTGIAGRFDIALRWTPDSDTSAPTSGDPEPLSAAPDLFTAITEQTGLKLVAKRSPTDVFAIDHVSEPSDN